MRTEVGGDILTLAGTGLTLALRKIAAADVASIGIPSLYDGWGFKMTPGSNLVGPGNAVVLLQAVRSSSVYTSSQHTVSDALSLSIWDADGALPVPIAAGSIDVSFTLGATANSPSCSVWDGVGWQTQANAMQTTYRTAGAAVVCATSSLGSFVVIDQCDPVVTCSGNGVCLFTGECSCNLGWTGPQCASQYCDSVLFPCANGGQCICSAEPYDCLAECVATSGCASQCEEKCPPGGKANFTVSDCPMQQGKKQTSCQCPCGFTGPRCETVTACSA